MKLFRSCLREKEGKTLPGSKETKIMLKYLVNICLSIKMMDTNVLKCL